VLFGANGTGKTTLLRILSTHVRPDSGTVLIAGRDLRRQPTAVRRRIGVVGHRSFLYDDLTCRENLVYYALLYRLGNHKSRVAEVLNRVGLNGREDQRVRTLSNGMQKRAAIARAILHQPDVLLLDEPEVGLDRASVAMLGDLLTEWTASGRSVVMTTHDVDLGLSWGQRAGVLLGGKVTFPEEDDPAQGSGIRRVLASAMDARDSSEARP
jgi:heme ABC exporter ATP-binding subunit CcmA